MRVPLPIICLNTVIDWIAVKDNEFASLCINASIHKFGSGCNHRIATLRQNKVIKFSFSSALSPVIRITYFLFCATRSAFSLVSACLIRSAWSISSQNTIVYQNDLLPSGTQIFFHATTWVRWSNNKRLIQNPSGCTSCPRYPGHTYPFALFRSSSPWVFIKVDPYDLIRCKKTVFYSLFEWIGIDRRSPK